MKTTRIILLICSLFVANSAFSKHIVGGVMTYKCLGNGNYQITLRMYRDCSCTNCADFDGVPGGQNGYLTVYKGASTNPFHNMALPAPVITNLDPNIVPCIQIPPNVCLQEGVYTMNLSLPLTNQAYTISYQRCCRNETISNIVNPGNDGATFTVTISPLAQTLCNNSPVFENYPPPIICAGQPLHYDHSAVDADGDILTYEFCSPLNGGSMGNTAPNPSAAPPFSPVAFVTPPYSASNPMGGNPPVTIDPVTGLITGTPMVQGQFVIGVCVKEYRNGQLLSTIQRDFQLNVGNCDPTVVAQVQSDAQPSPGLFTIVMCGSNTVQFLNTSYNQQFINNYQWKFFLPNGVIDSINNVWEPSYTFPDTGTYKVQLILNPGTLCNDTAFITAHLYPPIYANFNYSYDTCIFGPVTFRDTSMAPGSTLVKWVYDFGDNSKDSLQNLDHQYLTSGLKPITLTITDNNGCKDDTTRTVPFFPAPTVVLIEPSTFNGCIPADIYFHNLTTPIDSTYQVYWDFGDGKTGTGISPTHQYTDLGTYSVKVKIITPIGCEVEAYYPNWIRTRPKPNAGFTYSPNYITNLNPGVQFTDTSDHASFWAWDFGDEGLSLQQNPYYTFKDTGTSEVRLIITNPEGCKDTAFALLDVVPVVTYYLPNAFTPNNDAKNEVFKGTGYLTGMKDFTMNIWNRWGELMFETHDANEGWNGRYKNTGTDCPVGVYVVTVNYTEPRGKPVQLKGFATIVR